MPTTDRIRAASCGAIVAATLAAAAAPSVAASTAAAADAVRPFDPSRYSQQPTECDRLAAHPDDPDRVAEGRARKDIDLPKAIAACEAAVAAEPKNPRLNYQLARVYGYAGQGEKALPYRKAATDADYPQALFVVGYITLLGMNKQPQDTCAAAELIRRSAHQGRLAGQLGFVHYVVTGRFDACPVKKDVAEMQGFLAAAKQRIGGDYYQSLLVEQLERQLQARAPRAAN
jgi:tetratricopeptide (TPR) repeat protein